MPPSAYERPKAPQQVRAALLDATAALIAKQGLARVTVDAVARAAGVTKGGLFHHFPSKQALIDGVLDRMIADADATISAAIAADPEPHGRFTRALLSAVFADPRVSEDVSSRTLCLAMVGDPELQCRWTEWIATQVALHAATDDNPACAAVRLAADGVWLSSLHNAGLPPAIDPSVHAVLLAMTHSPSGESA